MAPKMGEDVYGKFLAFLRSPMWALPVCGFIEQRSIVFDKEAGDEKLYKQIHQEYRGMVDMLIGCFCEDTGIKPNQITTEIAKDGKGKPRPEIEISVLEPVLAAGELDIFVHMMMRKNIELQLQALQMIEAMCGALPAALLAGAEGDGASDPEAQERIILVQVMRQSAAEFEAAKGKASRELEDALKASQEERRRLEGEKREEDVLVDKALRLSLNDSDRAQSAAKRAAAPKPSGKVEDLKARQEYLRQQRDKLLNMKREARLKAFSDAEAKGGKARPSTAKAAKAALSGRGGGAAPKLDPAVLEARKALAQKLRDELM